MARRKSSLLGVDDPELQRAIQQSLLEVQRAPSQAAISSSLSQTAASLGRGTSAQVTAKTARRGSFEASAALVGFSAQDSELARQLQAEEDSGKSPAPTRRKSEIEDAELARAIEASYLSLQHESSSEDFQRADLVQEIYRREGLDASKISERMQWFLRSLQLSIVEAGSLNTAGGTELKNQCFYLSLARSYLGPSQDAQSCALVFKRMIEAAVLSEHPEWGDRGLVGAEVKAFSDFLTFAMRDKESQMSELAVVIVDSVSGQIEIYKGVNFDQTPKQAENLLMLWAIPGHYQCLAADDAKRSKTQMTLEGLKSFLDCEGLLYIETCG